MWCAAFARSMVFGGSAPRYLSIDRFLLFEYTVFSYSMRYRSWRGSSLKETDDVRCVPAGPNQRVFASCFAAPRLRRPVHTLSEASLPRLTHLLLYAATSRRASTNQSSASR